MTGRRAIDNGLSVGGRVLPGSVDASTLVYGPWNLEEALVGLHSNIERTRA